MTDPLTLPDCDLRGLPFMPLDVVRLGDSDLMALSTGDEFKAAVALWCKCWLQVPAASLPNDDRVLAHLSGTGTRWKKVREMALRGFVLCSDGRWYHSVIAAKANDAWERRGEWQERINNKTERQRRWRDRQKAISVELRALGITPPVGASLEVLERLLTDSLASTEASTGRRPRDAPETPLTGTGTVRTEANASADVDPDKSLFDQGVALLVSKGRTESSARSTIAMLKRDHGNPAVLDAIERCRGATEPVSAMRSMLGKAKRQSEYLGV